VKALRIGLAAAGLAIGAYGVLRLLTQIPPGSLVALALWLAAALVLHDGVLAPAVVGTGWALRRLVPDRGRRYLQAGLIVAGLITVIAAPMIALRGSQPAVKALLLQNYAANLVVLLAGLAGVLLLAYAVQVRRDRNRHGV
jgi:hypothetical protein